MIVVSKTHEIIIFRPSLFNSSLRNFNQIYHIYNYAVFHEYIFVHPVEHKSHLQLIVIYQIDYIHHL